MPDVEITIGDRKFYVACRSGEEHYLSAAAKMLDDEATPLQVQMGRLPEARMLLMAGLMLADRTASVEDELRQAKARIADLQSRIAQVAQAEKATAMDPSEADKTAAPIADQATRVAFDRLAELAARAEALATTFEERIN